MALLSVQNVSKTFKDHDYRVHAVRNASLEVHRGEISPSSVPREVEKPRF